MPYYSSIKYDLNEFNLDKLIEYLYNFFEIKKKIFFDLFFK